MVIKNSTKWDTNDLRMFWRRCCREVDAIETPRLPFHKRNKNFQLNVLNSHCFRGLATVDGYWVMIKIPKSSSYKIEMPTEPTKIDERGRYCFEAIDSKMSWVCLKDKSEIIKYPHYWKVVGQKDEMDRKDKVELARLMIHEYYHTIGYTSYDRNNYKHDLTKSWEVDWVDKYLIRIKQVAVKDLPDIKLVRYQRAIVNLRRAEIRLKRAKTIYRKWLEKTRRYEKICGSKTN